MKPHRNAPQPQPRVLLPLLLISLLPPLVGAFLLTRRDPVYWRHFALLTWYAVSLATVARLCSHRPWLPRLLFTAALLHLILLTPEVVLRLADFRYETGIQFGYPRPRSFARLVADEELFWKLRPEEPGVNSLGFSGPEVGTKKPGTFRVLVLGDSVPYQGYPKIVQSLLLARRPDARFHVINLSQAGYSSHQGRVLAERYAPTLEADLALVSYGWNDHWLAWGAPDAEKTVSVADSLLVRRVQGLYDRLRLAQAARFLLTPVLGIEEPLDRFRVPPTQYRRNLARIAEAFRDQGAPLLFLTAPSSHPRLGVPDYLIENGFARDKKSVVESHLHYNQILRQVASTRGGHLLDLEAKVGELDEVAGLFHQDGIHLSDQGQVWVAHHITTAVLENRDIRLAPPRGVGDGGSPPGPP